MPSAWIDKRNSNDQKQKKKKYLKSLCDWIKTLQSFQRREVRSGRVNEWLNGGNETIEKQMKQIEMENERKNNIIWYCFVKLKASTLIFNLFCFAAVLFEIFFSLKHYIKLKWNSFSRNNVRSLKLGADFLFLLLFWKILDIVIGCLYIFKLKWFFSFLFLFDSFGSNINVCNVIFVSVLFSFQEKLSIILVCRKSKKGEGK